MSDWIATNELRWYVNTENEPYIDHILQQKWVQGDVMLMSNPPKPVEEWRDVPVVEEWCDEL